MKPKATLHSFLFLAGSSLLAVSSAAADSETVAALISPATGPPLKNIA